VKQLRQKGLTIDEVACALGISKTTVSRAISGKGRVSEETRARVLSFIAQSGHTVSPEHRRTNTVSLVIPPRLADVDIPFTYLCLLGIASAAKQRNYDILLCNADVNDLSALENQLQRHRSDGAILVRTLSTADPCMELIRRYGLPCVALGRLNDRNVLQVDNDNFGAAKEMTHLLLQMGMKRIAYLYDYANTTANADRLRGFAQAMEDAGEPIEKELIYPGLITEAQRVDALEDALSRKVDCLLCCDDRLALYMSVLMRQRGIDCPAGIRLASLYDSEFLQQASITAVQFDTAALGATACRILVDAISGKVDVTPQVQPFQIILRESTK